MTAARTKVKPPSSVSATYSVISQGSFVAEVGWTAAISAWPTSYYVLYRDGNEIATSLTATTYRDTSVVEGVDYFYEVATVNVHEIEGGTSSSANLGMPVYPVWESGWTIDMDQNTTQSIASRATDPQGASLTFSKQGGTAPSTVTVSSAGVVTVAATAGGAYTLIVRASNGQLTADYTAALTVTTSQTAPGTPTTFAAVSQSSSSIALSWQVGTGQAPTSYELSRSLTGSNAQTPTASGWTSLSLPTALSTSYTNTGLSSSTAYFYRVRALNGALASSYATDSATTSASSGTTRTIPVGTSDYDASVANAGDTIVIARGSTGTRGPLIIRNAVSTGTRIRVVGDPAGLVTIRKTTPGGSGFIFQLINCHGVDFDFENTSVSGAGAENHCGVKIMYASGATSEATAAGTGLPANKDACTSFCKFNATTATNLTDDVTIRYLWIDGGWNQVSSLSLLTNGIGIQANHAVSTLGNGHFQDGLLFEYCLIENIEGEGMYVGTNWKSTGNEAPLRNVEVSHVTIRNTGQDGFNGKKWWEGTNSVHDCVVTDCGFTQNGQGALSGIAMMGSTASLYNNKVVRSGGPGMRFAMQNGPPRGSAVPTYGTYASFNCTAYNNEIIDAGQVATETGAGILTNNSSSTLTQLVPFFRSNSVTGGTDEGIKVGTNGEGGGRVENNVCLGNTGTQVLVGPASTAESGNLTSGITAANCFVNENSDLHLTTAGEAAALGCTGTKGTNYSSTDKDGASRSATPANAHKGAYET